MMGLFFHDGTGYVFYVQLPCQRRALRLSPAEIWLTVYCRRVVFGVKYNFSEFFWQTLELSNLFWP